MKNLLLKWAVRCARRFIPVNKKTGSVLIVSTTALGDTLWGTAAIENIRRTYPGIYLAVLTSPVGIEVLKGNPHINQLYCLKEPVLHSFFSLWKTLYQERFETVLVFHASQRLTLPLCALLGAERIIGTAGINKGLDELLTDPLPNHHQHEIVRRLKVAERFGAITTTETLSFYLQPEELLPERLKGLTIAIHPGSKDAFKRWPADRFIEVGRRLKKELDCEILITGNEVEKPLMEAIAAQIPGAQVYETNTTLRSFAALLSQLDLLISNDTGPVHLACALKTPVVAIYSSTDPALCGPHLAEKAIAIARRATCDPCLKRKCRQPFCFLQIGPEEVVTAAKKLLVR